MKKKEIKCRKGYTLVRCPMCGRPYCVLTSSTLIYCNKCGTLFEVHPYFGVRVLSRTTDGG